MKSESEIRNLKPEFRNPKSQIAIPENLKSTIEKSEIKSLNFRSSVDKQSNAGTTRLITRGGVGKGWLLLGLIHGTVSVCAFWLSKW